MQETNYAVRGRKYKFMSEQLNVFMEIDFLLK